MRTDSIIICVTTRICFGLKSRILMYLHSTVLYSDKGSQVQTLKKLTTQTVLPIAYSGMITDIH